jgi:hypothetical protein
MNRVNCPKRLWHLVAFHGMTANLTNAVKSLKGELVELRSREASAGRVTFTPPLTPTDNRRCPDRNVRNRHLQIEPLVFDDLPRRW